jgi:hypothetical protein
MGWLPYCRRVAESATYQDYLKKYPHYKTFVDLVSSPALDIPPQGPLQSFAMDQLTKLNDLTNRGTLGPGAAIEQITAEVEKEAKRQRRLGNISK